jgi:hypothetical protein
MRTVKQNMTDKNRIIKNIEDKPFFGKVTVVFQDGKPVRVQDITEDIIL